MKKILLIRHGKTQGNLERRYIGRTDEPLCEDGRAALEGRSYPACDILLSSPMVRCLETGEILYPGKQPEIVPDLRECDFGRFEGKTYAELCIDPDYQRFLDSNGTGEIPQGESAARFRERCLRGFRQVLEILDKSQWQTAAVICHGGTIMSVLDAYDPEHLGFYQYQVENGGGYLGYYEEENHRFSRWEKLSGKREAT